MLLVIRLEEPAILGPVRAASRRGGTLDPIRKARLHCCPELCSRSCQVNVANLSCGRTNFISIASTHCQSRQSPSRPHPLCDQLLALSKDSAVPTMSDAGISDNEVDDLATPAEVEEVEAPRDTVEENGLDEDEDDLFGDGGDDAEEPA
jgi:hypothetical protein